MEHWKYSLLPYVLLTVICGQRIRETVERGNIPLVVSNCKPFVG